MQEGEVVVGLDVPRREFPDALEISAGLLELALAQGHDPEAVERVDAVSMALHVGFEERSQVPVVLSGEGGEREGSDVLGRLRVEFHRFAKGGDRGCDLHSPVERVSQREVDGRRSHSGRDRPLAGGNRLLGFSCFELGLGEQEQERGIGGLEREGARGAALRELVGFAFEGDTRGASVKLEDWREPGFQFIVLNQGIDETLPRRSRLQEQEPRGDEERAPLQDGLRGGRSLVEVSGFERLPRGAELSGELGVRRRELFAPLLQEQEGDRILIVDRGSDAKRSKSGVRLVPSEKRRPESQVLARARKILNRVRRCRGSGGSVHLDVLFEELGLGRSIGEAPSGLQVGEAGFDVLEKQRRPRPADVRRREARRPAEAGAERFPRSKIVAFLEIEPTEGVVDLEDPGRVRGERRLQVGLRLVEPSFGERLAAELPRVLRRECEEGREIEHHRESTATGGAPRRMT